MNSKLRPLQIAVTILIGCAIVFSQGGDPSKGSNTSTKKKIQITSQSLLGTIWEVLEHGGEGEGVPQLYQFLAGGRMRYRLVDKSMNVHGECTWKQNGRKVTIKCDGFKEVGEINADQIRGTAYDVETYTWTGRRVRNVVF